MADSDIVILSGVRTAIGGFGGSLASVPPIVCHPPVPVPMKRTPLS